MSQQKEKPSYWYGVKGFEPGLICRGDDEHVKQYTENTVFEEEGGRICGPGMMHYVEEPLTVFKYYSPAINGKKSEYACVEALDEPVTDDNEKYATKKLKIGAKIDIAGIIRAQIEYVRERCEKANAGGDWSANAGGDWSANAGGDWSANAGGYMSANTGGVGSTFNVGKCSVALGLQGSKYKGGMWSVFAQPIFKNDEITGVCTAVVDGANIKPDTWYKVEDNAFVECREDECP